MKLDNHIAKRLLTDPMFTMEIVTHMYPDAEKIFDKSDSTKIQTRSASGYTIEATTEELKDRIACLYNVLTTPSGHKPYYCTETMLPCLDMLKINKTGPHYNWTYFNSLKDQKATFIFPDNRVLRMVIDGDTMWFVQIEYTPESKVAGHMNWVMFYLNRRTGELCDHFKHKDVQKIEKFVYSLLCFVYLADKEEIIVAAHSKYGTRKSGKLINSTPFPIIIINSKWNITSIRADGFPVSAHFAIRHTGQGRTIPKVVFIDQFEKEGYVRKGKPDSFQLSPIDQSHQ